MYISEVLTNNHKTASPHKKSAKKLSKEELLDHAKKVGNKENLEKLVTDLSKGFDNIMDEFKKVSEKLKETKDGLLQTREKKLVIQAQLTKMEIVTKNTA